MVTACAALHVMPTSIVQAAQHGTNSADNSGMQIVPRSAGVPTRTIPPWQKPASATVRYPSGESEVRQSHVDPFVSGPSRAVLQRPVLSQDFGPAASTTNYNRGTSQLISHSSNSGNLPSGRRVQEDGSLTNQPDGPGAVPEVPHIPQVPPPYRPVEPLAPNLQSMPAQPDAVYSPPDSSAQNFDGPAPQAPHGVAAPQPQPANFGHAPANFGHAPVNFGYAPGTSGFRATVESDAPAWMGPYYGRTGQMPEGREHSPTPAPSVVLPTDFIAWWDPLVRQSAGLAPNTVPVEVATLVQQALAHAPQVQVLQADPEVQYAIVHQEEAAFDWRTFLDAKYSDLNDPIGNTLTTGNNSNRFADNKVNSQGGFKRRTETGGEFQVAQSIGHQYNNSIFLQPNPQSTTRLELSFRQPLLSKAGTVYNQNQIVLAGINSNVASDETLQELQTHLFNVAEAYWSLYRARAEFFQRQKLLGSAQRVLQTLEGRNQVDTIPRQILRARAAVARAESRMQRAVTDIRNAESRLRLLVNDPSMLNSGPLEFTPAESPASMPSPSGLRETLETALVNRPDISRAIRQMRASSVRIGVSKSELLPRLDFLVTSYVAGLQNKTQIGDSLGNQFTNGRPGYTIGLEFEVPLGNRAAKAKMEQRQWELKRAISAFRVTVETSLTEVEIANREVDTAYREMLGKYQAMIAAQNEVAYLQDRFSVLPMIEDSTMLLLEDLLDGYERLADEESAFVKAQTSYALSIIELRRATGTLMRSRHEAPQIDPDESQWMTARAEQTAEEIEERTSRNVSFRPAEPVDVQGRPPAEWSQPLAARPGGTGSAQDPTPPVPVRQAPVRPASFGGHSFGN